MCFVNSAASFISAIARVRRFTGTTGTRREYGCALEHEKYGSFGLCSFSDFLFQLWTNPIYRHIISP